MSKTGKNLLIAVSISVIFLLVFLSLNDFGSALKSLKNAKPIWVLVSLMLCFGVWSFEALTLRVFSSMRKLGMKFPYLLKITIIGTFFSAITPFATGGQPAQIVFMQKRGYKLGESTGVLVSRFLVYQLAITVVGTLAVFLAYPFIAKRVSNLALLGVFGFLLNSAVLVFLLLFSLNKKITTKLVKGILKFLKFIKIIKDVDASMNKALKELELFHDNMKQSMKSPGRFFLAFIFTLCQLLCLVSVPYFVGLALGLSNNYLEVISAQLILFLVVSMIPTPGATGVSEGGYVLFFKPFFADKIGAGLLMWRVLTYYLNIIVGGLLTAMEINRISRTKSHR